MAAGNDADAAEMRWTDMYACTVHMDVVMKEDVALLYSQLACALVLDRRAMEASVAQAGGVMVPRLCA